MLRVLWNRLQMNIAAKAKESRAVPFLRTKLRELQDEYAKLFREHRALAAKPKGKVVARADWCPKCMSIKTRLERKRRCLCHPEVQLLRVVVMEDSHASGQ
jgi:hypothetical protein